MLIYSIYNRYPAFAEYNSYGFYDNGYGFSFKKVFRKVTKPIRRALPKPIRKVKPAKFLKRATGSKRMSSALLKAGAVAAAAGGAYYLAMNPSMLAPLSSTASKIAGTALTIGKTIGTEAYSIAKPVVQQALPQMLGVQPQQQFSIAPPFESQPYSIQLPYPTGSTGERYWSYQQFKRKSDIEEYLPLIALGGGMIILALLLRR